MDTEIDLSGRNGVHGSHAEIGEADRAAIADARAAFGGEEFDRLWFGRHQAHDGDRWVELCRLIAGWIGPDRDRVEAVVLHCPDIPEDWFSGPGGTRRVRVLDAALDLPGVLSTRLLAEYRFAQDQSGRLYFYDGEGYRPSADEFIERQVLALLSRWTLKWDQAVVNRVVKYVRLSARSLWDRPPENEHGRGWKTHPYSVA